MNLRGVHVPPAQKKRLLKTDTRPLDDDPATFSFA